MSINVYLREEEVKKLKGFTTTPRYGDKGCKWDEYAIPGVKLFFEKGRWHMCLSEPTEKIPESIKDIVEEITFFAYPYIKHTRESGIYKHGNAEMEVTFDSVVEGQCRYNVKIIAKNMEDILFLYRNFKQGSIRPEKSYDTKQGGLSNQELNAKLEDARQLIERQEVELASLQKEKEVLMHRANDMEVINGDLKKKLNTFVDKLGAINTGSFFSIRGKVEALINEFTKK